MVIFPKDWGRSYVVKVSKVFGGFLDTGNCKGFCWKKLFYEFFFRLISMLFNGRENVSIRKLGDFQIDGISAFNLLIGLAKVKFYTRGLGLRRGRIGKLVFFFIPDCFQGLGINGLFGIGIHYYNQGMPDFVGCFV